MKTKFFILAALFALPSLLFSQSLLNKKITVSFANVNIPKALKMIEQAGDVRFAYNSEIFSKDSLVSASFNQTEIVQVLDGILGKKYAYREKGNHIIIKSTGEIMAKNEKFIYTITGYVVDANSGEKIPFASIYDSSTLSSTISDASGFYSLNLEQKPGETSNIGVSKSAYKDTFILIKPIDNQVLTVQLKKIQDTIVKIPFVDSSKLYLDENALVKALTSLRQRMQTQNIQRSFSRPAQVSFLPYLGTNGAMSGKIRNHFSLNILGGYNGGFNGAEFGGLFNIDRDSCEGAQFAGIYNFTAATFRGAQFAGILNNHFGYFEGGQFAGIINTCSGGFKGFQAAGILNFNRHLLYGVQAAGLINYSDRVHGAQIAGLINSAGKVHGVQISGLVNAAKRVHGAQIGFINIADTVEGVQLGFLSFSRTGIHQLEYSYTDVMPHNILFRTGSAQLYNIIGASVSPYPHEAYSFTYGLGSRLKLGKRQYLHANLTASSFYLGDWYDIPSLYRLSLLYEFRLFKQVSIMAGPDLNVYYTQSSSAPASGYKDPISYVRPLASWGLNNGRTMSAWAGFHVGIGLN